MAAPVRLELTTHGLTARPLKTDKNATLLYFKGIQRFIKYAGYHLVTIFKPFFHYFEQRTDSPLFSIYELANIPIYINIVARTRTRARELRYSI